MSRQLYEHVITAKYKKVIINHRPIMSIDEDDIASNFLENDGFYDIEVEHEPIQNEMESNG